MQLSPNDFEIPRTRYKSHTVFDQTIMHAYLDVKGALDSIRKQYGRETDIVGDSSKYFEFNHMVTPNLSKESRSEKFWLDFTPLHYGGWRYWLKCLECRHRKTKLYITNDRVACMDCLGLVYVTKTGSKDSTSIRLYKYRKAIELLQARRKMNYAGKPTRFGRQFHRYYDNLEDIKIP